MSHQIRLRAAWERKVGAEAKRINLPDPQASEVVTYVRSFNAPSSIDLNTPIRFVTEAWVGRLSLYLDQELLIPDLLFEDLPLEVELSGRLLGFHQLTLNLVAASNAADQDGAKLIGPCYLLID